MDIAKKKKEAEDHIAKSQLKRQVKRGNQSKRESSSYSETKIPSPIRRDNKFEASKKQIAQIVSLLSEERQQNELKKESYVKEKVQVLPLFEAKLQSQKSQLTTLIEQQYQQNVTAYSKDQETLVEVLKQIQLLSELLNSINNQCELASKNLEVQVKTNKKLQNQLTVLQKQINQNQLQDSVNSDKQHSNSQSRKSKKSTQNTQQQKDQQKIQGYQSLKIQISEQSNKSKKNDVNSVQDPEEDREDYNLKSKYNENEQLQEFFKGVQEILGIQEVSDKEDLYKQIVKQTRQKVMDLELNIQQISDQNQKIAQEKQEVQGTQDQEIIEQNEYKNKFEQVSQLYNNCKTELDQTYSQLKSLQGVFDQNNLEENNNLQIEEDQTQEIDKNISETKKVKAKKKKVAKKQIIQSVLQKKNVKNALKLT